MDSRREPLKNNYFSEQSGVLAPCAGVAEWKNEYRQTKKKLLNAERETKIERLLQYNRASSLKTDLIALQKQDDQREFNREKEREQIFKDIRQLRANTGEFTELLKGFEKTPQFLHKIQTTSERLEEEFSGFKNNMMVEFDRMQEDYEVLSHELRLFEDEKLPAYAQKPSDEDSPRRPSEAAGEAARAQFEEFVLEDKENFEQVIAERAESPEEQVRVIEQILEQYKARMEKVDQRIAQGGGRNCGWSDEDQKEFLRLKIQHKGAIGKQAFLNDCRVVLGFMDDRKILEHIERWRAFEKHDEEKRRLVEQYKELKERKKAALAAIFAREEEEKCAKEQLTKKHREEEDKERERKRREVLQWKMRKEAIKEVTQEQLEAEKREQERLRHWAEYQKRQELKEKINHFKETRMIEKELQSSTQSATVVLTREQKEKIRLREEEMLRKQQQKLVERKEKELRDKIRQVQREEEKKIKFSYIEPKLNQPTVAHQAHLREKHDGKDSKTANTFGGQIVRSSGRAMAGWRSGV